MGTATSIRTRPLWAESNDRSPAASGVSYAMVATPWGWMAIVAKNEILIRIFLPETEARLRRRLRKEFSRVTEDANLFPTLQSQLRRYFGGEKIRFTADLDFSGITPFRRKVLEACRRIPYGKTASYQDLARAAGNAATTRAVGTSMAHNPYPLVIPCHRVLRADGSIGGFSSPAGVRRKMQLLELEGISTRGLTRSSNTKRLLRVSAVG